MKVVGLTGGIGSGKTTVANFFKEFNIPVYIADTEAKRLMNESAEVKKKISDLFGPMAYNEDGLDRKFISSKVFGNEERLNTLNDIVHPAVQKDFKEWKKMQKTAYVIYEAAILFEKGGDKRCDFTILVTADRERKIERLQKRDRSSLEEIEARMNHQWPDERKIPLADFIINNKKLSQTFKRVKEIHRILLNAA